MQKIGQTLPRFHAFAQEMQRRSGEIFRGNTYRSKEGVDQRFSATNQPQKLFCRPRQHASAVSVGDAVHRPNQRARNALTEGERIVASERKSMRADALNQKSQHAFIMHERVEVEALQLLSRIGVAINPAEIRSFAPTMFNAADGERKTSASMRKTHLQVW